MRTTFAPRRRRQATQRLAPTAYRQSSGERHHRNGQTDRNGHYKIEPPRRRRRQPLDDHQQRIVAALAGVGFSYRYIAGWAFSKPEARVTDYDVRRVGNYISRSRLLVTDYRNGRSDSSQSQATSLVGKLGK